MLYIISIYDLNNEHVFTINYGFIEFHSILCVLFYKLIV